MDTWNYPSGCDL